MPTCLDVSIVITSCSLTRALSLARSLSFSLFLSSPSLPPSVAPPPLSLSHTHTHTHTHKHTHTRTRTGTSMIVFLFYLVYSGIRCESKESRDFNLKKQKNWETERGCIQCVICLLFACVGNVWRLSISVIFSRCSNAKMKFFLVIFFLVDFFLFCCAFTVKSSTSHWSASSTTHDPQPLHTLLCSTRLEYTGLRGELGHLKIETRSRGEWFEQSAV